MPDYTLSAKITGDSSDYEKAVKDAEKSTEDFQKSTTSLNSRLAGGLKKGLSVAATAIGAVSAALGAGVAAGVKYNAAIEQYQTSFEVMTGSAEKAVEVVDRLKKLGAETPFELPDLAETTQLLMNYGFTADEAIDRMQMLGDISQGSADKMQRVATAYGQMSSAGKVQLEDVKQMIEAGFNPLQEISESTGESMQSLYDRISDGTLAVDEITASMQRATSEGGKYFQSMEKQSQTINGLISTLKDNAQQLLGEVIQPLSEGFRSDVLPAAINSINELTTAFQERGSQGLIEVGGGIVADIILGIARAAPSIIATSVQILSSIISSLKSNLQQIVGAGGEILLSLISGIVQYQYMLLDLTANLIYEIVSGLINNAPQLTAQANTMMTDFCAQIRERFPDLLQSGADAISSLLTGLLDNAPSVIEQGGTMITTFVDTILSMLPQILQAGVDIALNLLNGIVANAPDIIHQAAEISINFISTVRSHLPQILQTGIELIGELLAGIIRSVPDIIAAIPGIIYDVARTFLSYNWSSVGADIIAGIARGIANAGGAIVDAAVDAAKSAFNAAKKFLGINSPSTLFRDEIGRYMALGMGVGFETNIPVDEIKGGLDSAVNQICKHYTEAGQRINLVEAITGMSRVAETYQADVSNIFEGVTIVVDNTTNLDGAPIYQKASEYTIRRIGNQQRAVLKAKGAYA